MDHPRLKQQARNTGRVFKRAAFQVRLEEPDCHLCGYWIDKQLTRYPHADPLSSVIDHVMPVFMNGTDDRSNLAHAHAICNKMRGISPITSAVRAACRSHVHELITSRQPVPKRITRSW